MQSVMLACTCDVSKLKYPVYVTSKFDGIRAYVKDGVVYSRTGKPIPNQQVQDDYGHLHGVDGELVAAPGASFSKTTSAVMAKESSAKIWFMQFDDWTREIPYEQWLTQHSDTCGHHVKLWPAILYNEDDVNQFCSGYPGLGQDGWVLRSPTGMYKQGRSTMTGQEMMKIKPIEDDEAEIIGFVEMKNHPEELGAFHIKHRNGVEFYIGTGLSRQDRKTYWTMQKDLLGHYASYSYQSIGRKGRPRHPVFMHLRHREDI